jgi:hypothetical protein
LLSSYETTKWKIKQSEGTTVSSVVVHSHKQGSRVEGIPETANIQYKSDYIGARELYARCPFYSSSYFYCEGLEDYKMLFKSYGHLPNGAYLATFTSVYSTSTIMLPGRILKENEEQELDAYVKKIKADFEAFKARSQTIN